MGTPVWPGAGTAWRGVCYTDVGTNCPGALSFWSASVEDSPHVGRNAEVENKMSNSIQNAATQPIRQQANNNTVGPNAAAPANDVGGVADESERRVHERVPVAVDVNFESDSNFYTGLIQDISEGGLFIASETPRERGDEMIVHLKIPGCAQPFEVRTEVRWVRDNVSNMSHGLPIGMGVRFVDPDPALVEACRQFIKQRESLFFEE